MLVAGGQTSGSAAQRSGKEGPEEAGRQPGADGSLSLLRPLREWEAACTLSLGKEMEGKRTSLGKLPMEFCFEMESFGVTRVNTMV